MSAESRRPGRRIAVGILAASQGLAGTIEHYAVGSVDPRPLVAATVGLDRVQEQKVIARFSGERNEAYQEFISRCDDLEAEIAKERGIGKFTYAEVEENEEDLTKLQAWLAKIVRLDFYSASLRAEAEERLARCAALLDDYAREVFEAQDENRPNRGGPVRSET